NPSLTSGGPTVNCVLTGQPINLNLSQTSAPTDLHFNTAAFALAVPTGLNSAGLPAVGTLGSAGTIRMLRNPTWHEWDLTVSRRFPVNAFGRKNSGIKLQIQVLNLFNEVQFTTLNAGMTFIGPTNSALLAGTYGQFTQANGANLAAGTIAPRVV